MENAPNFSNHWLPMEQLPQIKLPPLTPLMPVYKRLLIIRFGLFYGLLLAAIGLYFYFEPTYWYPHGLLTVFGVALFASLRIIISLVVFKTRGYAVRTHDLLYQQGIWFFKQVVIPIARVQHVNLGQSPLEKMFGLAHLTIFTAGGAQADLTLRGISYERAEELRTYLLKTENDESVN